MENHLPWQEWFYTRVLTELAGSDQIQTGGTNLTNCPEKTAVNPCFQQCCFWKSLKTQSAEHSHMQWAFSKVNPRGSPRSADAIDISQYKYWNEVFSLRYCGFFSNWPVLKAHGRYFLCNETCSGQFLISFFSLKNY